MWEVLGGGLVERSIGIRIVAVVVVIVVAVVVVFVNTVDVAFVEIDRKLVVVVGGVVRRVVWPHRVGP